jgi:hypothetical protein
MSHIFLSYSRADTEMMRRVRNALVGEGLSVWTDENLLPGTPSWQAGIQQAIEKAWCVVVLLSPDAKKSDWIANELSYADMQDLAIFPVLIRGEEKESVLLSLINIQRIDVRTRFLAQMQALVDALEAHQNALATSDERPVEAPSIQPNRNKLQLRFWKELQERSKGKTSLFINLQPHARHWMSTSAGRSGISLGYVVSMMNWSSVELYIDVGDKVKNKSVFDTLFASKEAIETEYGDQLVWQRLDNKRASRIMQRFDGVGLTAQDKWPDLQDRMIDAMIRLDHVFRPRLANIKL